MKICVHFFLFQLDTLLPLKFQIFSSLPFLFHSGSRGAQSSNLNATQHGRQHREQRCQEESVRNMFQLKRKCFLGASCWDLKSELLACVCTQFILQMWWKGYDCCIIPLQEAHTWELIRNTGSVIRNSSESGKNGCWKSKHTQKTWPRPFLQI